MNPNIDALERRLQAITTTLIHAQTELARVKQELEDLRSSTKPVSTSTIDSAVATQPDPVPIPTTRPHEKLPPRTKKPSTTKVEEFIGGKVITLVGIFILVIGLGIFVKYAVERDLIGPIGRVTLGMMAGAALLGVALRLKSTYPAFSSVLLSGALVVLYFYTYASYDFYSLVPQWLAFLILIVLTSFAVLAATMYNREIIAILGLVGAYAVPFLLSDGSGRVMVLFSYTTLVNTGILILSYLRYWRIMNWTAFGLTWLMVLVWFGAQYEPSLHQNLTIAFTLVFFLMFQISATTYKLLKRESFGAHDVVLVGVNSLVYYSIGYSVFDRIDDGLYLGIFTLFNATLHGAFALYTMRAGLTDRRFFLLEIALMLACIVVSIPVQLDGNWVTLAWAAGASMLVWIGMTHRVVLYQRMGYLLLVLSFGSLLDDWSAYSTESFILSNLPVLNVLFLTSLLVIASWWHSMRMAFAQDVSQTGWWPRTVVAIRYAMIAVGLVLIYLLGRHEVGLYWDARYFSTSVMADVRVFDEDLRVFKEIWQTNVSLCYFMVAAVLVRYKWPLAVPVWSVTVLGFTWALFSFFHVLPSLHLLIQAYLQPSADRIFPVHEGYLYLRYFYYPLPIALLWVLHLLPFAKSRRPRQTLTVFLHACILVLLSFELKSVVIWLYPENADYYADIATRLGFSLLWGTYSLVLIGVGILHKKQLLRMLGIGIFGVTLAKLYLFDLGEISTGSRIILFLALGVLLLVIAFLYQKFKSVIFPEDEKS